MRSIIGEPFLFSKSGIDHNIKAKGEFPDGLAVRIWCFHCCGLGWYLAQELPHAMSVAKKQINKQKEKKTVKVHMAKW